MEIPVPGADRDALLVVPVEVGAANGNEADRASDRRELTALVGRVLGVVALHAVDPDLGERLEGT